MSTTTAQVPQIAEAVADLWDWQQVSVTQALGDAYVVSVDGLPHAVARLYRPGSTNETALESQVAWVQALDETGVVRAPTVLTTRTGTAVGAFEGQPGRRWNAICLAYEPELATPPQPGQDTESLRALGGLAARLHEHSRTWTPPPWFRRPSFELTDLADSSWDDAEMPEPAHRMLGTALEEALDVVSWAGPTPGLVHGNLRRGTSEGVMRTFDCRHTWWEQDLAGSLTGLEHTVAAPSLTAAWVEGYEEVATFGDRRLAGALVTLGCLSSTCSVDSKFDVATRFLRSHTWLFD